MFVSNTYYVVPNITFIGHHNSYYISDNDTVIGQKIENEIK